MCPDYLRHTAEELEKCGAGCNWEPGSLLKRYSRARTRGEANVMLDIQVWIAGAAERLGMVDVACPACGRTTKMLSEPFNIPPCARCCATNKPMSVQRSRKSVSPGTDRHSSVTDDLGL